MNKKFFGVDLENGETVQEDLVVTLDLEEEEEVNDEIRQES